MVIQKKEIILFAGPPGAGKTGLGKRLATILPESLGAVQHLSLGAYLRQLSAGQEVTEHMPTDEMAGYLRIGRRLPRQAVRGIINEYLWSQPDQPGLLLMDGYPRTAEQVTDFAEITAANNFAVRALYHARINDETSVLRQMNRNPRPGDPEVTEDFASYRLTQHNASYPQAQTELAAMMPIYELDAHLPMQPLVEQAAQHIVGLYTAMPAKLPTPVIY